MEGEYARENGAGHGCLFIPGIRGAGKGDALYNQSLSAWPGKANGRRERTPPTPIAALCPAPEHPRARDFRQRLRERGAMPRAKQRRGGREGKAR